MEPMESASQWIVLAQILRPQGRKGEVLADLFSDFPERFATQPYVWLAPAGFADSSSAQQPTEELSVTKPAEVASHWLPVGRNAGRIVLRLIGIDSIEQAAQLTGYEVLVPSTQRMLLEAGHCIYLRPHRLHRLRPQSGPWSRHCCPVSHHARWHTPPRRCRTAARRHDPLRR